MAAWPPPKAARSVLDGGEYGVTLCWSGRSPLFLWDILVLHSVQLPGGVSAQAGRPPHCSFRCINPGCSALIPVRRVILTGFFCRPEKIDELAEIDVDHRRRVEGQEL